MRIAALAGAWALVNNAKEALAKVIAESGGESGEETAELDYVRMLADWWFSQSLSDRVADEAAEE